MLYIQKKGFLFFSQFNSILKKIPQNPPLDKKKEEEKKQSINKKDKHN